MQNNAMHMHLLKFLFWTNFDGFESPQIGHFYESMGNITEKQALLAVKARSVVGDLLLPLN